MRISVLCLAASFILAGCGGSTTPPPPPPVAPTVTSTTPGNSATSVAVNATVTATFSAAMNSATITSSSFTLTPQGGSAVSGTVTYSSSSNTATFTPGANLGYNTQYTATITTAVTDSAGTALAANDSWTFTTAPAPPTVTAVTPASAATAVPITSTVTATFSEAMNDSTITASTFTLAGGGGSINGTVTYSSSTNTATFTPASPLSYSTQYTATITTSVQSSQGAALAANYTWSFTTMSQPPPPTVAAVTPAASATSVALNTSVSATFSAPMNAATISGTTFTLATTQGNTPVTGAVTLDSATEEIATFEPAANLTPNTSYTATITTGAQSQAGVALAAAYTWSFTTAPAPTVSSVSPASGATNVSLNPVLSATFGTPMNASTITTSTFTLNATGGASVSGTVAYNSTTNVATFTPSAALAASTSYTATITTGATSAAEVPLAANYVWVFSTGIAPTPVTVDFGTTYQTISGFGGSSAWLGQMSTAIAKALFSPTDGIGLSILRMRIDPTGSSSGGGNNGDPYETGEWDYEAANGAEAVANNPDAKVFASPWTPPTAWKLSGTSTTVSGATFNEAFYSGTCNPSHSCGGYLDPAHYADYASYLEDFVSFFNTTNGFNLYAISMQNEPEENVSYESCVWTPAQMDAWVAGNGSTITADPYHTKLIMPESDDFNPVDASTTLNDTNAQGNVNIIGGHIYQTLFGGSITPYSIPAGDSPKELWMTEFGPLSQTAPTWSQALSIYALNMHNAMVTGQYNAYVWWGAFGYQSGNCATAAGTCGLVDGAGNVTVTGEVMGQYSKFIQPGYVRASATATPTSGVYVSAYENATPEHYVIVAINTNTTTENLAFTLDNATVTSVTPYQSTSATGGLAAQPAISVSGGQFTYLMPAQSIVTFVQ